MLLAEGVYEQFKDGYYKLVRNPRKEGQGISYYDRANTELGAVCLIGRPCLYNAVRIVKSKGLHVIVSGYIGWHPLYDFADEYWGNIKWGTKDNRRDIILKAHPDLVNEHAPVHINDIEFSLFGLPQSSPKALKLAELTKRNGKYVTIAPIKRKLGFEARDFTEWKGLAEGLNYLGYKVYATCPKEYAYPDLPCEYISDMTGENNLMDLELALHHHADVCFSSNTGSAGLMIYANCPVIFVFGGVLGYPPGWEKMVKSLSKIEGYRTKLVQPSCGGSYRDQMKDILRKVENKNA